MYTSSPSSSISLLRKALKRLGYSVVSLQLGEEGYTLFTAPNGRAWLTPNAHISYPFITNTAHRISVHKHLAYRLADYLHVTTPKTLCLDAADLEAPALQAMLRSAPLVVKPDRASLSRGLSTNVRTLEQLRDAVNLARQFSSKVLVQQQINFEEIRFVVVGNKVKAALLRQTPRVVGNGKDTVQELLSKENKLRAGLKLPYLSYPQLEDQLISPSIALSDIPAAGEIVEINRRTMVGGGASIYNVLADTHPSYLKIVEKLATQLGNGFVVVDMLIEDYRARGTASNYAFLEFNMAPVLTLFYSCRDGKHYDVLKDLVPFISETVTGERQ
jgi:D-alanine-D-alanine ligase-like ATP-grasp enzyme